MLINGCAVVKNFLLFFALKMAVVFDLKAFYQGVLFCADKISPMFYYLVVQMKIPEKHATKRR